MRGNHDIEESSPPGIGVCGDGLGLGLTDGITDGLGGIGLTPPGGMLGILRGGIGLSQCGGVGLGVGDMILGLGDSRLGEIGLGGSGLCGTITCAGLVFGIEGVGFGLND